MSDTLKDQNEIWENCRKIASFRIDHFFAENPTGEFGEAKNFRGEKYSLEKLLSVCEKISHARQSEFLALTDRQLSEFNQNSRDLLKILQDMRTFHEKFDPNLSGFDEISLRHTEEHLNRQRLNDERKKIVERFTPLYETFIQYANIIQVSSTPDEISYVSRRLDSLQTEEAISKYKKIFSGYSSEHQCAAQSWLLFSFTLLGITVIFAHWFVYPEIKDVILEKAKPVDGKYFFPWQSIVGLIIINLFALALLSSVTFWSFKNYSVHKHNQLSNRLKSAALRSYKAFSESTEKDKAIQHIVVKKIADTVFDMDKFGYLKNEQQQAITPSQVIDAIIEAKKEVS